MIHSLWPSDATWRHRSGSTLTQAMAWCLTAPSHYLKQCWLLISKVQWHSSEGNLTKRYLRHQCPKWTWKLFSKIWLKSHRGQWVNPSSAYIYWIQTASADALPPGARLTKTYDVITLRYRKLSNVWHLLNAYFAVYGFQILCEISKGTFEISQKILKPYTAKYTFYCFLFLRVSYDIFELWRHKP